MSTIVIEIDFLIFPLAHSIFQCSTFLKTISNQRGGFLGVEGDVSYAGLSADEFQKRYKGEVVYNQEVSLGKDPQDSIRRDGSTTRR